MTSLITKVIQNYYPDWDPPKDRGQEWVSCLCPFHGEARPSATVSFVNDAFACFACGEKGDALALIMRREVIGYREAVEFAEELQPGSRDKIQKVPARKQGRRSFDGQGSDRERTDAVRTRVRGRPTPWS